MPKISTARQLTLEEFLALPEEDVNYEFIDSYAVPKVSPKYFHSALQAAILTLIRAWCKGKGRAVAEWAILLKRRGQDWAPLPDVVYISYERLPKSWQRNAACPIPPELVIEIISPNQTIKEFEEKAEDYLTADVSRVWVIDPNTVSMRVFLADGSNKNYTDNTVIQDALFPGLDLSIKKVFAEADLL